MVTGASRGIGNAIARALLTGGYRVACGYHAHRAGAAALERDFPDAYAVAIDIRRRTSIRRAIAATEKRFGATIDIVVNNAAIADEKPLAEISDADWDRMLETNLRGPFAVAQETLPAMTAKHWGRIVNIVSIGGQWGGMRQVHYAAAKAGLINFTHSLAKLYSRDGITANAVSPGLVATDMTEEGAALESGQSQSGADSGGPHRDGRRHRRGGGFPLLGRGRLHHRPHAQRQWRAVLPMTKTLLIISGGIEAVDAVKRARDMGLHVVVSDIDANAPGFAYAHDRLIADVYGPEETACAAERYHREQRKIDGVLCVAADAPVTAALVAERLGLPGISVASAKLACDKLAMKRRFKECGVPVPWFAPSQARPSLTPSSPSAGPIS